MDLSLPAAVSIPARPPVRTGGAQNVLLSTTA